MRLPLVTLLLTTLTVASASALNTIIESGSEAPVIPTHKTSSHQTPPSKSTSHSSTTHKTATTPHTTSTLYSTARNPKTVPGNALTVPKISTPTSPALPAKATDQGEKVAACQQRNPNLFSAIQTFCDKTNIVVPSTYASNGSWVYAPNPYQPTLGVQPYYVMIQGWCNPPQWVPQKYCLYQFFDMCTDHDAASKYGKATCQNWQMFNGTTTTITGGPIG